MVMERERIEAFSVAGVGLLCFSSSSYSSLFVSPAVHNRRGRRAASQKLASGFGGFGLGGFLNLNMFAFAALGLALLGVAGFTPPPI